MNIHRKDHLWKSPVEKSVENVEKWWFSTGISAFYQAGSICINCCITGGREWLPAHYVSMVRKVLSVEEREKVGILCEKGVKKGGGLDPGEKSLVKINKKPAGMFFAGWEILFWTEIHDNNGGTMPCREK